MVGNVSDKRTAYLFTRELRRHTSLLYHFIHLRPRDAEALYADKPSCGKTRGQRHTGTTQSWQLQCMPVQAKLPTFALQRGLGQRILPEMSPPSRYESIHFI
jgi:hypothetical protein